MMLEAGCVMKTTTMLIIMFGDDAVRNLTTHAVGHIPQHALALGC